LFLNILWAQSRCAFIMFFRIAGSTTRVVEHEWSGSGEPRERHEATFGKLRHCRG